MSHLIYRANYHLSLILFGLPQEERARTSGSMRLTKAIPTFPVFLLHRGQPPRIAKGTRDVTLQAMKALADTLAARMELALKRESLTSLQLQKALRVSAEELQEAITRCRAHLLNVGSDVSPTWMWRPGTSRAEVHGAILRCISERPMTIRELSDLLGVKFSDVYRVIGVLKVKHTHDKRLQNIGTSLAPKWFFIPEGGRRA